MYSAAFHRAGIPSKSSARTTPASGKTPLTQRSEHGPLIHPGKLLQINEVLAANSDSIELYYDGAGSLDLGGYRITDNNDLPDKFVFTAGTIMNPGDYLVVYADSNSLPAGIHTGFNIDADGDDLILRNPAGTVVDSVVFGAQLDNLSIGRLGNGQWHLTVPTAGFEKCHDSPLATPQT